jgi:hypothetical protein
VFLQSLHRGLLSASGQPDAAIGQAIPQARWMTRFQSRGPPHSPVHPAFLVYPQSTPSRAMAIPKPDPTPQRLPAQFPPAERV